MEDIQIIDLYWRRDEEAIRATDVKYGRFCHRLAMNILRSFQDSEECVNDTYGRCWDTMPPQRPRSLRAYLGTVIRNLSISRYRACRAQKRFGGAEELGELISGWLDTQDREDRALFIRRYWNGEAVKELAGELGVRPNALTKRLLRLREDLRRALEKGGVSV